MWLYASACYIAVQKLEPATASSTKRALYLQFLWAYFPISNEVSLRLAAPQGELKLRSYKQGELKLRSYKG